MKDKNVTSHINQEEIQYYLKDIRKIKVMTPQREKELAVLMKSDQLSESEKKNSEKELLIGNLRFVISVAKQYQNQGLDLPDLIAEGNLGLMKAIKNFDWNKDLRFISYAVWWVKQTILQSLHENSRTIRLPVNVVQDLIKAKKQLELTGKDLSDKLKTLPSVIDLQTPISDEGDTLLDVIPNKDVESPDSFFDTKDILKEKLLNLLNVLDERERLIVGDYFGITGNVRTLEEIGLDFDLTKERIRQIKDKALRKLRNESSDLFDYF